MKLYYHPGACSLAPHIVLEWIGQPYEAVRVEYGAPDYLRINPAGSVPTLDTGEGWTLTQCGAILHHLARCFPEAGLGGDGAARTLAELDRWSSFLTGDLHPAFFPAFVPGRYTKSADPAAREAVAAAALDLVRKRLDLLDAHLADREYIVGAGRTFVDAYSFPMVHWATTKLPGGLNDHPSVRAHHERLAADPAVRKVLADEEAGATHP